MISFAKSLKLDERTRKVTPGPQSNLAGLWPGAQPLFIDRGKGAHLWDADGNEYIDYTIGMGPGILGHGNEKYIQALKEQLDKLIYLAGWCQSPMEAELGEKFVQLIPCAERVRFLLSGTEAVQLAIRLARAYTKRYYFVRFEGHYHGWLDNVLGGTVDDHPAGKPFALDSADDPAKTEGRDPTALEQSFKIPWNDIEVLESVVEKYGEEIAMIHMEPILCNYGACLPRPGYLERVRELCDKYGIVLSFDEIITGFRVGLSGAQGLLGVTPDMATFGKAMAGGVPMAAVAGKKEILDLLIQQRVLGAGTFNGYPFGLVAALATIKILEKDDGALYRHVDKVQNQLMSGLKEISNKHGIPMLIQGPRGVFFAHFLDREIVYNPRELKEADMEKQKQFRSLLLEEGINIFHRGRWYVSGALTEADVDRTLECADRAMSKL
jgi:glutamate-1-semialdehyde 2,1-aminomutase